MLSKIRLYLKYKTGSIKIFEDVKRLAFDEESDMLEWNVGEDTEWDEDIGELEVIRYSKEILAGGSGASFTQIIGDKFYDSLIAAIDKRIKELNGKIEEIPLPTEPVNLDG